MRDKASYKRIDILLPMQIFPPLKKKSKHNHILSMQNLQTGRFLRSKICGNDIGRNAPEFLASSIGQPQYLDLMRTHVFVL